MTYVIALTNGFNDPNFSSAFLNGVGVWGALSPINL